MPPDEINAVANNGALTDSADKAPPQPYAVFPTAEMFQERVTRATQSELRKRFEAYGVKNEDELKERLKALSDLKKQEEERKTADMSAAEKERQRAEVAEQRAKALESEKSAAVFDAQVARLCAERGIRDVKYAKYLIADKQTEVGPDGLEPGAYLDTLLQDDRTRVAFGVAQAAPADPVPSPATTTPGVYAPPPPPRANQPAPPKDVFQMSKQEFAAHVASK